MRKYVAVRVTDIIPQHRVIGELTFEFVRPPDRRVRMDSRLLHAADDVIITAHQASPSKPVEHLGEVVLDKDYWAVWFLFKDRPFDVGRFYRPDGAWTGYYVDVLEPVRWVGTDPATLEPMVDLFLDLWIAPSGEFIVLDEDEFEEAIDQKRLRHDQIVHARRVLEDLIQVTQRGAFPPAVVKNFRL